MQEQNLNVVEIGHVVEARGEYAGLAVRAVHEICRFPLELFEQLDPNGRLMKVWRRHAYMRTVNCLFNFVVKNVCYYRQLLSSFKTWKSSLQVSHFVGEDGATIFQVEHRYLIVGESERDGD